MKPHFPDNTYQLPVYRKALEIFRISRSIASYFSEGKHVVEMDLSTTPSHRHVGFMVVESLHLAPGVASVLNAKNPEAKLKKIKSIRNAAKKLKQQCKALEASGVKEVEFIDLLRKEIHKFEHMASDWLHHIQNPSK